MDMGLNRTCCVLVCITYFSHGAGSMVTTSFKNTEEVSEQTQYQSGMATSADAHF